MQVQSIRLRTSRRAAVHPSLTIAALGLLPAVLLVASFAHWINDGTLANTVSGILLGLAIGMKILVWPAFFVRRGRESACSARRRPCRRLSLLLVLPDTGLDDYVGVLRDVGRTYNQDATRNTPYPAPGSAHDESRMSQQ